MYDKPLNNQMMQRPIPTQAQGIPQRPDVTNAAMNNIMGQRAPALQGNAYGLNGTQPGQLNQLGQVPNPYSRQEPGTGQVQMQPPQMPQQAQGFRSPQTFNRGY